MLIQFTVDNYLSFNTITKLSMEKGPSRKKSDHVIKKSKKHDVSLLKGAAIYGPNAAGKSNFVEAMSCARDLIVRGYLLHVPIEQFKLTEEARPSFFQFDIKINNKIYIYGFKINPNPAPDNNVVVEEYLHVEENGKPVTLFERTQANGKNEITLNEKRYSNEDLNKLKDVALTDQLFLSRTSGYPGIYVKIHNYVFEFFLSNLNIYTNSNIDAILQNHPIFHWRHISKDYNSLLEKFDTGISSINLYEETIVRIIGNSKKKVSFNIEEESYGTRRLMYLLLLLIISRCSSRIFIIDDLDRNLHPHLSRLFVESFYEYNEIHNSQLIFTTHESSLLDLDLLRRDEIWFMGKNINGESELYSLEEFKPYYNQKDVRGGYLDGRFGAVPFIKQ